MTYSLRPLKDPDHYHHDFEIDTEPGKPVALVRVPATPEGRALAETLTLSREAIDTLALLQESRTSMAAWAKVRRVLILAGRRKPSIADYDSFPEMAPSEFSAMVKRGRP